MNKIKGILIDSGKVLNFAAAGDWSYSPKFFQIVDKNKFYSIPKAKRRTAYKKAMGLHKFNQNPQMYKAALKELGLNADEVVFIDDNPRNCDGAFQLGIKAIILNRKLITRTYISFILKTRHKIVRNLYGIEKFTSA